MLSVHFTLRLNARTMHFKHTKYYITKEKKNCPQLQLDGHYFFTLKSNIHFGQSTCNVLSLAPLPGLPLFSLRIFTQLLLVWQGEKVVRKRSKHGGRTRWSGRREKWNNKVMKRGRGDEPRLSDGEGRKGKRKRKEIYSWVGDIRGSGISHMQTPLVSLPLRLPPSLGRAFSWE